MATVTMSILWLSQLFYLATAREFPWIKKFSSIGDSYAAGLGAGPRVDYSCSRYGHSYPSLLHSSYLGDDQARTHQFLACSGAKAGDVLEKQIPALEHDIDLLTISAGGNDIGLSPILNNCIYQFYLAGKDDCKNAIDEAQRRIQDDGQLYGSIVGLINAAKPKVNATVGMIYLTGYAGFFGTDDHICDNVTWSVWRDVPSERQYLKLETRRQLDDMVRSVNEVLRRVAKDTGPNVRFVDYDEHIKKGRGRYCEAGVHEPDPNRLGLSFYEWNTVDSEDNITKLYNTGDDVLPGSFEGDIATLINKTLVDHPEWEFEASKGFVNKSKIRPDGFVDDTIWWLLPDSWKRVFHPRPEAHAVIAQLIVNDLVLNSPERRDSITTLLLIATAGFSLVVLLILLLLLLKKRERKVSWQPAWLRDRKEASYDPPEDGPIPSSSRSPAVEQRQYDTFA
ncbi:SGNH hydrolase [Lophiostoma macrostomum CBS 122681]|uniref:SGNH hydrolase n=1 Tax=Lophiostoma macrostomum CBS 122681 TaxID=1314788 RepID=A0A6A6T5W8_9PLEO|nr:SGNH hydrolase [Lophiostoma macrostomum CBS 122681]